MSAYVCVGFTIGNEVCDGGGAWDMKSMGFESVGGWLKKQRSRSGPGLVEAS